MILLIDNYDSFSYNLYQVIGAINPNIKVVRNDCITVEEILELAPSHIILSPGPGKPSDAGICIEVVKRLYDKIPILGVCLGHQAICEAFGATVSYAKELLHGKSSVVKIENDDIYKGLPENIKVARYHSLSARKEGFPDTLRITAVADDGEIMSVRHTDYPVYGLQFHPESILTPDGSAIIKNFLEVTSK
ncbi:MAG: aminodeoxychorismate/anthranilate synthase component II [Lachnospiraceae bacterium]|nr:aminodeoxychorismate/anthranilate synthase component II [Lachnospiraceae bacterium]